MVRFYYTRGERVARIVATNLGREVAAVVTNKAVEIVERRRTPARF